MESIIQSERECFVCKTKNNLHMHHIFYGTANREVSERNGFKVYLCGYHHNLSNFGVHFDNKLDIALKRYAQQLYEQEHTRADFIKLVGKSYL